MDPNELSRLACDESLNLGEIFLANRRHLTKTSFSTSRKSPASNREK